MPLSDLLPLAGAVGAVCLAYFVFSNPAYPASEKKTAKPAAAKPRKRHKKPNSASTPTAAAEEEEEEEEEPQQPKAAVASKVSFEAVPKSNLFLN